MKIRQNTLLKWRREAKLNQKRFGKLLNMKQQQLCRYELQQDQPQDDTCFRILASLEKLFPGIKYDDLWIYIEKDGE